MNWRWLYWLVRSVHWWNYWLIDWLMEWLIDWLIDGVTASLIDWLIDWSWSSHLSSSIFSVFCLRVNAALPWIFLFKWIIKNTFKIGLRFCSGVLKWRGRRWGPCERPQGCRRGPTRSTPRWKTTTETWPPSKSVSSWGVPNSPTTVCRWISTPTYHCSELYRCDHSKTSSADQADPIQIFQTGLGSFRAQMYSFHGYGIEIVILIQMGRRKIGWKKIGNRAGGKRKSKVGQHVNSGRTYRHFRPAWYAVKSLSSFRAAPTFPLTWTLLLMNAIAGSNAPENSPEKSFDFIVIVHRGTPAGALEDGPTDRLAPSINHFSPIKKNETSHKNQSINQSINQTDDSKSLIQSINQSINQTEDFKSFNQSINPYLTFDFSLIENQPINRWINLEKWKKMEKNNRKIWNKSGMKSNGTGCNLVEKTWSKKDCITLPSTSKRYSPSSFKSGLLWINFPISANTALVGMSAARFFSFSRPEDRALLSCRPRMLSSASSMNPSIISGFPFSTAYWSKSVTPAWSRRTFSSIQKFPVKSRLLFVTIT